MRIEGFDYKSFAINFANQAADILTQQTNAAPESLTTPDKKMIIDTVRNYCMMSGEALNKDTELNYTAEQASLIVQFIAEWTFHKSIDLINGKIPNENRLPILQTIAANIFSTAKLAVLKQMPQEQLINLIEDKVNKVYSEQLQGLVKRGVISQGHYDKAVNLSNLKDLVEKTEEENKLNNAQENVSSENKTTSGDTKILKLAALAIVLKKIPQDKVNIILTSLSPEDVRHVVNYMKMPNLEAKIDHKLIIKSLNEIKKILPFDDTVNVPRLSQRYKKLIGTVHPKILHDIAITERENVRSLILNKKFQYEDVFSPQVLKSLVATIEDKINDYKEEERKHR